MTVKTGPGRGPAVAKREARTSAACGGAGVEALGQNRRAQPAIREEQGRVGRGPAAAGALRGAGRGARILLGGEGRCTQVFVPAPLPGLGPARTGPEWRLTRAARPGHGTGDRLPLARRPHRCAAAGRGLPAGARRAPPRPLVTHST